MTDSYVVVARRYRPKGFDELVGQQHVGRALKNAIETHRVGHAYLFTGARGVGKTSTARIFAKALNDPTGPTASPDNDSDVAQAIDAGEDVDVIEIDGASNRGIDEIRSLRSNVNVRPSRSRYKIYIIDEVHMLTGAAFNALLKTLEEPPEHVKFIFCTTDPEKIPITVLSRCQRFDFAPVEVPKIVQRLQEIVKAEGAEADDAALELIARRAAGSMRDSQSLLEQVMSFSDGKLSIEQVHSMLGTADDERLHALAKAMADRDAGEVIRQMDAGIDAGVDAGRLAEQLLAYFRDLMTVTVGCDPSMMRHTSAALYDELRELGDRWGLQTVLAVVGLVDQTLVRIRHSVYARVLLEATLIQICHLPDLQEIVDLAAAADSVDKSSTVTQQSTIKPTSPETTSSEKKNVEVSQIHEAHSLVTKPKSKTDPVRPKATIAGDGVGTQLESETVSVASSYRLNPIVGDAACPAVWNQQTAVKVFEEAKSQVEAMTETLARAVEKVTASDGKLQLAFPAESKLAMSRCENATHKSALAEAISKLAGTRIELELIALPPKQVEKKIEQVSSGKARMLRMKEIEENAMVKACMEELGAEMIKIDRPR